MALTTVYNTTDTPVTVDAEGRSIGAREWGTVDTTEEAAKVLLVGGTLLEVSEPDPAEHKSNFNPDALAAFERTKVRQDRHESVKALSKEELLPTAVEAGLVADKSVGVEELRTAVANATEVQLPSKSSTRKREA